MSKHSKNYTNFNPNEKDGNQNPKQIRIINHDVDFSTLNKLQEIDFEKSLKSDHVSTFKFLKRAIEYIKDINEKLLDQEIEISGLQASLSDLSKKVKLYEPSHNQVLQAKNAYDLYLKKAEELKNQEKYSAKKFVEKILEPLNFFEKAIEHSYDLQLNQEMKQWLSGFELILDKLRSAILSEGLKEIPVKVGDKFNEKFHHAIENEASSDQEDGTIIKIIRKGYTFHDLVLSHVLVKVVKNN